MAEASVSEFDALHEKYRRKVCVVCYSKATRELSANEIETVKTHIIDGFEISNSDFPCGVCVHCHITLSQKRKNAHFKLPDYNIDYEPNRPTQLRSLKICTCRICEIATANGLQCKKAKGKRGRPSMNTATSTAQPFKVCSRCFARIYRGSNHSSGSCIHSRRGKLENISKMINSLTSLQ